jgi:hypothetical protein
MKDLQPRNQGIGTVEETSGSLQRWWRGRNDDLKRQPFFGLILYGRRGGEVHDEETENTGGVERVT